MFYVNIMETKFNVKVKLLALNTVLNVSYNFLRDTVILCCLMTINYNAINSSKTIPK